ncbi:MAG: transglutaminase-like domain-containing protein [Spirochaetes bacterium]|nr:transglutaminase-like domain-containing protein [Spirochaetota bacterium]
MKQYLRNARARTAYFLVKAVAHVAAVAGLGLVFARFYGPLESVLESFPGLPEALLAAYAASVTLFYLAFSYRLRFSTWAILLVAAGAAVAWSLWPSAEAGLFAAFFFRYRLAFTVGSVAIGALNGTGFARWKWWTAVELCAFALLLAVAAGLTDRYVGETRYVVVALAVWYFFHALITEKAFSEYSAESADRRLFLFKIFSKYVLNVCVIALAFLFLVNFGPTAGGDDVARNENNSPYTNGGDPGKSEGKGGSKDGEGGDQDRYVHELKPFVKMDPSINLGDKTLLYQIALEKDTYARLTKRKGFPVYLSKFVLAALDEESMTFQLEPNPGLRRYNAFVDEEYDWNAVEMHEGSVVPVQTGFFKYYQEHVVDSGLPPSARREIIDATVRLSPFVKDDALIAPDFPAWVRMLERKSREELLAQLEGVSATLKGDDRLDEFELEKIVSASYDFKALSYPAGTLAGLRPVDAETALRRFPEARLQEDEREYFLRTGRVSDALRTFTVALVADRPDALDKARVIAAFFMQRKGRPAGFGSPFAYDLNPGKPKRQGEDYLDYFILENRKGYCQYYAVASALMMRIAGIPSRVVAGYVGIERSDRNPGYLYVYANQAHAWTEIFLDGFGWIPLDTTAPAEEPGRFFDGNSFEPPRRDPTPPEDPPPSPEYGVMTVIGRYLGSDGKVVTLAPEAWTIGAPVVLRDAYAKAGKPLMEPYASHDVYFGSLGDIVGDAAPVTIPVAGLTGYFASIEGKDGTREYEVVEPADTELLRERFSLSGRAEGDRIVIVGRFPNDEITKQLKDVRSLSLRPDYAGTWLEPVLPPKPDFVLPLLLAIAGVAAAAGLFPVLVTAAMYARAVLARGPKERFKAAYDYVLYRVYLLGYRTRGRTRVEWARDLKEDSGFDFIEPTERLMRTLYDPDCPDTGVSDARAFMREQSIALIRDFTYERVLASLLNPFAALSWLYGRGPSGGRDAGAGKEECR